MARALSGHGQHFAWQRAFRSEAGPDDPMVLLLLHTLHSYMNESGKCWPTQETLARDIRRSKKTVQRLTRKAEKLGWIKTIHSATGRGRRANEYRLCYPDDFEFDPVPCSSSRGETGDIQVSGISSGIADTQMSNSAKQQADRFDRQGDKRAPQKGTPRCPPNKELSTIQNKTAGKTRLPAKNEKPGPAAIPDDVRGVRFSVDDDSFLLMPPNASVPGFYAAKAKSLSITLSSSNEAGQFRELLDALLAGHRGATRID